MANRMNETVESPWKLAAHQRYESFLEQLSAKGRATLQKNDDLADVEGAQSHGELWKRFAGGLGTLARHATEMYGQHSVKFYIADGKYKQQVFALEDTRQGTIAVYLPDVLKLAISEKIIALDPTSSRYKVPGSADKLELLSIDAETRDLTVCKAMVGWGRRAIRVEFPETAPEAHVHAVELMCELAAQKWANLPAPQELGK